MAEEKLHLNKAELESLPLPTSTSSSVAPHRRRYLISSLLVAGALVGLLAQFAPSFSGQSAAHPHPHLVEHGIAREARHNEREQQGYLRSIISKKGGVVSCHGKHGLTEQQVEEAFLAVPNAESAREASHSFTAVTHIAGTEADRLSALRVKSQWEDLLGLPQSGDKHVYEAGSEESKRALVGGCPHAGKEGRRGGKWRRMKRWARLGGGGAWRKKQDQPRVYVDTYYPLLNYPVSHSLTLTPVGAKKPSFVASLAEDVIPEDPTSGFGPATFHGFSKNGTAKGQLVYVGRGTKEEFDSMVAEGIDFKNTIVLAQYSGSFRGLKVQAAAQVGAVGVLIYSDPAEDGNVTVEAGIEPYPHGPARQPSSVQRGSVQFLSIYPGDPLTPFVPAHKNASRLPLDSPDLNIPSIPSIPISYEDAIPLLKSLHGRGIKREDKPGFREGGLGYRGVEYWSGPSEDVVELSNIMDDKITPIWNTYAVIPGHLKDEIVVLGNHNDAWTFGAGDPNSGTAAVHEIVKGFGELRKKGWKPLRTIIVASWDAEEYGLIGSTEWTEDHPEYLKSKVVAYLNVDVAVAGTAYDVAASPSLADLLRNVSSVVPDPDQYERSLRAMAVADLEQEGDSLGGQDMKIGPLGSGSDFTGFLQYLGLASGNVGYRRKSTDPVYHYHSNYDSAYWQDNFGDPSFRRHEAIAKVLGLATLRLADSAILPINVTAYAHELSIYAAKIPALTIDLTRAEHEALDLASLDKVIAEIKDSAATLDTEIADVHARLHKLETHRLRPDVVKLLKRVRSINKRLQQFEGTFIDEEGLPGRPWYRSLVVAPGRLLGYGATSFPAVTESLTLDHNATAAAHEVKRLVKALGSTVKLLQG